MAKFRSIIFLQFLIIFLINSIQALYEDQVGIFDWKRSYIGKVNNARFDNNKRLIVTTDENVLASLNTKTGQLQWRQLLENPLEQQFHLLHIDNDIVITVSGGQNSFYVRGWDSLTGSILSEWTVYLERFGESFWSVKEEQLVHALVFPGSHMEITLYNIHNGENRNKSTKITTPWISDSRNCVLTLPYFVCLSDQQLYFIDILKDNRKVQAISVQNLIDNQVPNVQLSKFDSQQPSVLILAHNDGRIVEFVDQQAKILPYSVQSNIINIDNRVYQLEINAENREKLIRMRMRDLETGDNEELIDVDYPLGLGAPYMISGQCRGKLCDLIVSSTDNALTFIKLPDGKTLWTREEALSQIVASEYIELPVSELESSIEDEFTQQTTNLLTMFLNRLTTQIKQLTNLLFNGQLLSTTSTLNNGLIRDEFGLHKIIVVATKVGKLFAIDTLSGTIVWSYRLPNISPFNNGINLKTEILLFVQRTARYSPLPAQCILLAKDSNSGNGVLFKFDPITGISTDGIQRLNYQIKQALILPQSNPEHLRPVVIISQDDKVHVYPEECADFVKANSNSLYFYTVEPSISLLKGYKIIDGTIIKLLWKIDLGVNTNIVSLSTRPILESVHSQGRVLPDRSVYYKYINPNLITIATLTDDPVHKHVLTVYIIDGITGLILYSTTHKKAKNPIHLVHSENWLVYTFYNERFRRTELVAAEMYEGHIQSNSTVFSSYAVNQLPHTQTQSYILPAVPSTISVTLTERGITNKFLLICLTNGNVMEIPWMLIQPRFHDIPCGPEESCIPYMPEIPLPNEATINYNQTINRCNGIQIAPARLESTSHVLVYGLDLFYTRVAPSKTFDVLKEDFDHRLIVLVLTGLIIATYITKHLASKKQLRQAWK